MLSKIDICVKIFHITLFPDRSTDRERRSLHMYKKVLTSLSILSLLVFIGVRVRASYLFEMNCSMFLKRAADAATPAIAGESLDQALGYIEAHRLTTGFTSVIWRTPNEDIGFWYRNIRSARGVINELSPHSSLLEQSNVLIRVREVLTDHNEVTFVTVPSGISIYPHNQAYLIWGFLSGVLCIIMLSMMLWKWMERD